MNFTTPVAERLKKLCFVLAILTAVAAWGLLAFFLITRAGSQKLTVENSYEYCSDEIGSSEANWTILTDEGEVMISCIDGYEVSTGGDSFVVTTTIDPSRLRGNTVHLFVDRVGLTASTEEDGVLYDVNCTELYRAMDANGDVIFSLPEGHSESYVLTLEFSHLQTYYARSLKNAYTLGTVEIGTRHAIAHDILRKSIFACIMIVTLLILGLGMAAMVIYFAFHKMMDPRLLAMSLLMLSLAVWAFADSAMPQLLGVSLELSGMVSNLSLAVLPVSLQFFMWHTCGKHHGGFRILVLMTEINIILQCVLSFTGVLTLHSMLFMTHIVLGLTVLYSLIVSILESKKGENVWIFRHGVLAMGVLIINYLIVAILYYLEVSAYSGVFLACSCLVVLIFFAMLFMSYMSRLRQHRLQRASMETYQNLALKDGMTDLSNRRAFEQSMKAYDENPRENPDALLTILDLNGLKKINDELGQSAGDEAILAVADAIKKVYGFYGECFRIGGDEFAVILTDLSRDVRLLHRQFDAYLESYHMPGDMKLSAAKGSAELYDRNGRRLTTSEWKQAADLAMYSDKQRYASGHVISRAEDLQSILDCVIGLVEAKDQYTAKHSERVREMSVEIAKWMNLSPDTIEQIDMAAHLHDIGKVGIPESVLMKPGKLTEEEFAVMKEHPVIGALVIEKAQNMSEIADIVKFHHERYDGKGYPLGLSGDAIPLGARIVAVADSIDAMTSKRCYRDSLGLDVCRDEIERNLGKMYDPAIGTITLEHWSEIARMVWRG